METKVFFHLSVTLCIIKWIFSPIVETSKLPLLEMGNVDEILRAVKIIPDVFTRVPFGTGVAEVTYTNTSNPSVTYHASFGNRIPEDIHQSPPSNVKWFPEWDRFYTIIFTDADADPKSSQRERQLWVIGNCVSHFYEGADTLTEYAGPEPAEGTGLHRIVIAIFKQKAQIDFKEQTITTPYDERRNNFSTIKFAEKYKLGDLYAVNFFTAEYEGK